MPRRATIILTLLLGLTVQPLLHAEDNRAARVLNQKLMLLDTLVNKSKKGKQIETSSSSEAKELLTQARELIAIARTTFYEGDLVTAEQAVNDALNSFDTAKLMLKHSGGSALRDKERFTELNRAIAAMQGSLSESDSASLDRDTFDKLMTDGERLGKAGDYAGANNQLNSAYQMLTAAANRDYTSDVAEYKVEAPLNQGGSNLVERSRYRELQQAITSFERRLTDEQQGSLDSQKIKTMINQAEQLTRTDDYAGANRLLNDAYQIVVAAVSSGYSESTVTYSLDFASPREEYDYEVTRYNGNHDLVEQLLAQRADSPTNKLVVRYLEQANETRDQARQQAESGDHASALVTMEEAAKQLKRAMGMLGLRF